MVLKHTIDIVVAVVALLLLWPIIVVLAIAVRMLLGTPILFKQTRIGLDEKPFQIFKFRTMTDQRNEAGELCPDSVRLTRFGKFLRSTSLDELPELYNILRREMSLVGPRPLLPDYLPLYNARQAKRHKVRPGLTGWAQVNGRNALDWKDRLEMDAWYVENRSLLLDLKIICKTALTVLRRDGISSAESETMTRFRGNDTGPLGAVFHHSRKQHGGRIHPTLECQCGHKS
jgi:lipopolysaccharide/colanic/teichoic acid biosynthesis glycosyltransferase